jgi:S1-C subfamily serine protease
MADRRLARTGLNGRVPFRLGTRSVQDDHARATAQLANLAGAEAASFFAAPVVTLGNGTADGSVDWLTALPGDITPLAQLEGSARQAAEDRLRRILARLQPLLADQDVGAWLRRALVVPDAGAVQLVGGVPVLTDWGLAPPGLGETPAALERAMRGGLGSYLPAEAPPPAAATASTGAATVAAATGTAAAATATAAATAPPPPPPPRVVAPVAGNPGNRFLVPAAIAVAAIFLALGIWIGARIVQEQLAARNNVARVVQDDAELRRAIDLQRQQNEALERRIADARGALEGNMCLATPGEPRLGPDRAAPVPPTALPPPAPNQPRFEGRLAELLDQGVVLVIVRNAQSTGTGTGFFITPELIVTNKHVVESGGEITVASRALGRIVPAQLAAGTPGSDIGTPDFAVLRVPVQPVQPLGLTTAVGRLDEVIAAGFPALVSSADPAYQALIQGDASAVANLQPILSDGRINAVQPFPSGLQALPHSAQISPGSSGGPLVDACGRVVGVNTFGRSSDRMPVTISYAQKSDSLAEFLRGNNLTATVLADACRPVPAAAAPPAGAAAPGAAPAATPPPTPPAAAPAPVVAPAPPAATPPQR